jgi:hypothetical protein
VTTVAQLRTAARQWKLTDAAPVVESGTSWGPVGAGVRDGKVIITMAPGHYCGWGRLAGILADVAGDLPVHIEHDPGGALTGTLPVKQVTLIRGAALMMQLVR